MSIWRLIKIPLSVNDHSSQIKNFRGSFENPTVILRGGLMIESVAKSFAQTNIFANSEKTFAGSHVGTLAAFVMDNLYVDL